MKHDHGTSQWLLRRGATPISNACNLFCFPCAGCGCSFYRDWPERINTEIRTCLVQLPGREGRYREAPATNARTLAHAIVEALAPVLESAPFAFFGHSMGGLLCYEVCRLLERSKGPIPLRLFISASRAPHLPDREPPIHALPDRDFLASLQKLKGLPPEVLRHEELLSIVMPVLRADIELCETYNHGYATPMNIPITAFAGCNDPRVPIADAMAWSKWTLAGFNFVQLNAEHFYFDTHLLKILETIKREIGDDLCRGAPIVV